MTITAVSGPMVQFGATVTSTAGTGLYGQDMEHNPQRAPAMFDLWGMLMDPRAAYQYQPGASATTKAMGFYDGRGNVDYVPFTSSGAAFVAASVVSTGVTTFTITASSAQGIYATTIIAPETGKASGTLYALESTAAYLAFAGDGAINAWNPANVGRCISITTSSSGDGGTYSIAGRDVYGYKMTETLTVAQGTSNAAGYTIIGQKAFKYISSITNTTTPTSTGVSIGFSDRFGFPLAVSYTGQNASVRILATAYSSAAAVALSSANTILASTAATQTSTTPDVRGTYTSTTGSSAGIRLQMLVAPTVAALNAVTLTSVSALFGGTQYSSV